MQIDVLFHTILIIYSLWMRGQVKKSADMSHLKVKNTHKKLLYNFSNKTKILLACRCIYAAYTNVYIFHL